MSMKRILSILMIAIPLVLFGCMSKVPLYVASKTESALVQMRDNDFQYYSDLIKQNRERFEKQVDAWYVWNLQVAETEGALSADGVIYLAKRESEKRSEFDANEAQSIANLKARGSNYEYLIELQHEAINSYIEQQEAIASAIDKLANDLKAEAQLMALDSVLRREQLLKSGTITTPVSEPSTEAIVVPTNVTGE